MGDALPFPARVAKYLCPLPPSGRDVDRPLTPATLTYLTYLFLFNRFKIGQSSLLDCRTDIPFWSQDFFPGLEINQNVGNWHVNFHKVRHLCSMLHILYLLPFPVWVCGWGNFIPTSIENGQEIVSNFVDAGDTNSHLTELKWWTGTETHLVFLSGPSNHNSAETQNCQDTLTNLIKHTDKCTLRELPCVWC